jgi:hypothetical protein
MPNYIEKFLIMKIKHFIHSKKGLHDGMTMVFMFFFSVAENSLKYQFRFVYRLNEKFTKSVYKFILNCNPWKYHANFSLDICYSTALYRTVTNHEFSSAWYGTINYIQRAGTSNEY